MLSLDHPMLLGMQQLVTLSEDELKIIGSYFKPIVYEKDTIILKIGQIDTRLFFVEEGVLQEFSYQEENDQYITNWLMPEGSFIYSTISFLSGMPTEMGIKAIENVKLLYITKEDIEKLYIEVPQAERIGRLLAEQYMVIYERFLFLMRYKSSDERLTWFEQTFPTLLKRIPLKYIASYLNIRPETLSRVRAKRAER
jgi:CRP-like cAMP-binding protein